MLPGGGRGSGPLTPPLYAERRGGRRAEEQKALRRWLVQTDNGKRGEGKKREKNVDVNSKIVLMGVMS